MLDLLLGRRALLGQPHRALVLFLQQPDLRGDQPLLTFKRGERLGQPGLLRPQRADFCLAEGVGQALLAFELAELRVDFGELTGDPFAPGIAALRDLDRCDGRALGDPFAFAHMQFDDLAGARSDDARCAHRICDRPAHLRLLGKAADRHERHQRQHRRQQQPGIQARTWRHRRDDGAGKLVATGFDRFLSEQ